MNFYEYMMTHHLGEDSPAGDLAEDMERDDSFPKIGRHRQVLNYLHEKNAIRECLDTFEECWKEYMRHD